MLRKWHMSQGESVTRGEFKKTVGFLTNWFGPFDTEDEDSRDGLAPSPINAGKYIPPHKRVEKETTPPPPVRHVLPEGTKPGPSALVYAIRAGNFVLNEQGRAVSEDHHTISRYHDTVFWSEEEPENYDPQVVTDEYRVLHHSDFADFMALTFFCQPSIRVRGLMSQYKSFKEMIEKAPEELVSYSSNSELEHIRRECARMCEVYMDQTGTDLKHVLPVDDEEDW